MSREQMPPAHGDGQPAPGDDAAFRRLLNQAQQVGGAALGELLETVRPYLLAKARRTISRALAAKLDPADLVQETALEIHRGLGTFRGRTRGEFLAWSSQILAHRAISASRHYQFTRKRELRREVPLDGLSKRAADSFARTPRPPDDPDGRWAARLEAAIARLPDRMRQSIRLRYFELLSYREIAVRMQCSAEAARKLCGRAARRLRRELASDD